MNARSSAATAYQQHDIQTSDPLNLIVRVYDLAALQLARASAALDQGDPAAKGRAVQRAHRCLALLQGSLDMERGGEVARNLDRLYTYLGRRLTEAHLRNDPDGFAEVRRHVEELREAWREAAQKRATAEDPAPVPAEGARP